MKLQLIKNAVTSRIGRQILVTRKHSPVILFVAGTTGMVGTTVLACRATLKLEGVIQEAEKKKVLITQEGASFKTPGMSDLNVLRIQTVVQIGRLYAPAIGLGIISVGCLTGAHVTLTKRNTAVMAAYAALNKGYDEYRQRVREHLGEDEERQLYMQGQRGNFVETDENGKKTKTPVSRSLRPGEYSEYARLWSKQTSLQVKDIPEYNLAYLTGKQNWMNDRLRARGHVFLNEVYDELGLSRTKPGAVVGWLLDGGNSDNFIDFGILDPNNPQKVLEFITGEEGGIWLDFNVDGIIYDQI